MKYKKRGLVEAWSWNETITMLEEIGCGYMAYSGHKERPDECRNLSIKTIEKGERVYSGDFIIKNGNGSFNILKKDIFHKTYEIVT